jgi:hypothetical protein
LFGTHCDEAGLSGYIREFKFLDDRKFRFDYAWPKLKVAAEIQGGVFTRGGHATGVGITRDCEKLALANIDGWTLFHFTSNQVRSKEAVNWIKLYFASLGIPHVEFRAVKKRCCKSD